jgi:hypothetical protein
MSLIGTVQYIRDANRTNRIQTSYGEQLTFERENQLGFMLTAQARF